MNDFQPRFVFREKSDVDLFDAFVLSRIDELRRAIAEMNLLKAITSGRVEFNGLVYGISVESAEQAAREIEVQIARHEDMHTSLTAEIARLTAEEERAARREKR